MLSNMTTFENEKAFQSNASRRMWARVLYKGVRPCTEGGLGPWPLRGGALYRDPLGDRMTDRQTRLKTLPSRNFVGGR